MDERGSERVRDELADLTQGASIEYELRYEAETPSAGVFALDLLHLDREVRRTARFARDSQLNEPLRILRRPLPVSSGLVVREGEPGSFRFLLDVPPELYHLILSQPFDFVVKLFELTQMYGWGTRHLVRRRKGRSSRTIELSIPEVQEDLKAEPSVTDEIEDADSLAASVDEPQPVFRRQVPQELARAASSYEIIQRVNLSNGTQYEFVQRLDLN